DAAENGKHEALTRRNGKQHALIVNEREPVPRGACDGHAGEGDGRAFLDGDADLIRPDARDGGVANPVDSEQVAAAFVEWNIEDALAGVLREDGVDAGGTGVDCA